MNKILDIKWIETEDDISGESCIDYILIKIN